MRDVRAGVASSEYVKAQRAEVAGFIALAVGFVAALVALPFHDPVAGAVGCAIAAIGAYLVAHTGGAYAQSRGAVKAAAVQPPPAAPVVNVPPSVTHITATVKPRAGI